MFFGIIWGDYGLIVDKNIIYGLDLSESVECEISLFFESEELIFYKKDVDVWIY